MRLFRRRPADADAHALATHAVKRSGEGSAAAIISAIALLFSAYSLWETSLKQADLSVYVSGVVSYGRDTSDITDIQPLGGLEVLAVPITIANSGARDAAVLSLQLDVKNPKSGLTARFEATYTADAAYFAATGTRRPKTPFSALVIAGRSAWTGTVLFYPVSYSNEKALTPVAKVARFTDEMRTKYASELGGSSSLSALRAKNPNLPEFAELDAYGAKVVTPNDKVEVTLNLVSPAPGGWLDRLLSTPAQPTTLTLEMPNTSGRSVENDLVRLRTATVKS
jgi:hypothetical protein